MSFLTGFVTGLAGSIDKQLQSSIERTRENIDMVSKWRLKKAEEREKERKKKDEEIETLIQDAAYTISGSQNDVDAQNLAAALYKEQGLTGFTEAMNAIKKARAADSGVNPLQYITRAQTDTGNKYSLSQIVRSLSDAELSYVPDSALFPKGIIKGGGLIKAIAPDFDIMSAGDKQANEQMQQIGFKTTPDATSLTFGKVTFDREGLNYHTMDTDTKLSYLNNIIINESSTDEQVEKAKGRRESLYKNAVEQGDDIVQQKTLKQRLSLLKPEDPEYNEVINQLKSVDRKIKLDQAKLEGEESILRVRADFAAQDGDVATATRLSREADDLKAGGYVSLETRISRINEDIQQKLQRFGDAYKNSEGPYAGKGMKEDIINRNQLRTELENLKGATDAGVNQAYNNIYSTAKKNLAQTNPKLAKALESLTSIGTDSTELAKILKLLDDSGKDSIKEFQAAIAQAIKVNKEQAIKEGWNTRNIDLAAERFGGIDLTAVSTAADEASNASAAVTDTGTETDKRTGTGTDGTKPTADAPVVQGSQLGVKGIDKGDIEQSVANLTANATQANIDDTKIVYPTVNDAVRFVQDGVKAKNSNNQIVASAIVTHGADSPFVRSVEAILKIDSVDKAATAVKNAGYVSGTMTPEMHEAATTALMSELDIDKTTAEYLLISGFNQVVSGEAAAIKNRETEVKDFINRQPGGFQKGLLGGVPEYRKNDIIDKVVKRFNMSKDEATSIVNSILAGPPDAIKAEDIETISGGGTMSRSDLTPSGSFPLLGNLTAEFDDGINVEDIETIGMPEKPTEKPPVDVLNDLPPEEPDVVFVSIGKEIGYKKVGDDYFRIKADGRLAKEPVNAARKAMLNDPDRRNSTGTGSVIEMTDNASVTKPDQNIPDMPTEDVDKEIAIENVPSKKLINKYIDVMNGKGSLTTAEAAEIESRLNDDDSFVDLMADLVAKASNISKSRKEKQEAAQRLNRTLKQAVQKQKGLARGGLMRKK